jgi:hypothetical protein
LKNLNLKIFLLEIHHQQAFLLKVKFYFFKKKKKNLFYFLKKGSSSNLFSCGLNDCNQALCLEKVQHSRIIDTPTKFFFFINNLIKIEEIFCGRYTTFVKSNGFFFKINLNFFFY